MLLKAGLLVRISKILILGSTRLTEHAVSCLIDHYNLIGYVPSENPTVAGNMILPKKSIDTPCDIKLSIQYDKVVVATDNAFNVHTGLLPEYGGTNILSYTLKHKEPEQGLTFHKMTAKLDQGPIISKTSYPVFPSDSVGDLYNRMLLIGPQFVLNSLRLLESLTAAQVEICHTATPTMYKRGEFKLPAEIKAMQKTPAP